MKKNLEFIGTCCRIIIGLGMFLYALWQAHAGKYAEAAFWMAFSIRAEQNERFALVPEERDTIEVQKEPDR